MVKIFAKTLVKLADHPVVRKQNIVNAKVTPFFNEGGAKQYH